MAAQLQELLLRGEYGAGEKLPPAHVLSEQFGVGRSSVREALHRLEAEGFLRLVHGVGAVVTEGGMGRGTSSLASLLVLEDLTVPELFEARHAVEPPTAALAGERVTPSEITAIEGLIGKLLDDELSDEAYVLVEVELQTAIASATKNRVLVSLNKSLKTAFAEYAERVLRIPGRRDRANRGHEAIVDAIIARRPSAARRAVIAHLEESENDILEYLAQENQA